MGFYRDVAESVDPFGKYRHINNVSLPIRELDNVPHVSKVLSVFLFFFFFPHTGKSQWTCLQIHGFILGSAQICCWVPLVNFSFQLLYFSTPKFLIIPTLLTSTIWWQITPIFPFNSLNISITADLNISNISDHSWSKIRAFSRTVSINCYFFSRLYGPHFPYPPRYLVIFGWKLNILKNMMF